MKVNKLKKSLSMVYLTKKGLDSSFFIVAEKNKSSNFEMSCTFLKFFSGKLNFEGLKHPLTLITITNLAAILAFKFPFVFINFKEFFIRTKTPNIFCSLESLNSIGCLDIFCFFNPDRTFQNLEALKIFSLKS
jgi:hypothetical protein